MDATISGEDFTRYSKENLSSIFGEEEFNGIVINSKEAFDQVFGQIEDGLADATAEWTLFKKLVQKTKVVVPKDDDDEDGGKKRPAFRIDEEKKALFELAKLEQQALIDRQKAIAENEDLIIEVRQIARENQLEEEKKLVDLISNYELDALKEKAKYDGKTDEQIKNQSKVIQEEALLEKYELNRKYYSDLLDIVKSYNKEELNEIKEQQQREELIRDEKVIAKRKELEGDGVMTSEEINKALVDYKNELYIEDTKNFIKQLIAKKEAELLASDNPELQQELRRQIADLEMALADVGSKLPKTLDDAKKALKGFLQEFQDEFFGEAGFDFLGEMLKRNEDGVIKFKELLDAAPDGEKWAVWANGIMEVAQEAFNFINQQSQASFNVEYERLETQRDVALQFAGESTAAQEQIEEQYEARRKAIQARQARSQKKQAIVNTIFNTAQGIVSALAQVPKFDGGISATTLATIIGSIGAAQIALIASTPLPEFFRGTENAPEGWAKVDEKRPEVHTDRQGNVKSMGESKSNYRYLSAGDKIYKSHEEWINKEFNDVINGNDIVTYNEAMSQAPSVVIKDNGFTASQMDSIIGKHFSSIQTQNTIIDKDGVKTFISKGNSKTIDLNNRVSFKGISV
jgi:hypothetical protein